MTARNEMKALTEMQARVDAALHSLQADGVVDRGELADVLRILRPTPPPSEVAPGEVDVADQVARVMCRYQCASIGETPCFTVPGVECTFECPSRCGTIARAVSAALTPATVDEAKIGEVERLAEAWVLAERECSSYGTLEDGRYIKSRHAAEKAFRAALRAISPAGGR